MVQGCSIPHVYLLVPIPLQLIRVQLGIVNAHVNDFMQLACRNDDISHLLFTFYTVYNNLALVQYN